MCFAWIGNRFPKSPLNYNKSFSRATIYVLKQKKSGAEKGDKVNKVIKVNKVNKVKKDFNDLNDLIDLMMIVCGCLEELDGDITFGVALHVDEE